MRFGGFNAKTMKQPTDFDIGVIYEVVVVWILPENERICWLSPLQVIVIEILLAFRLIVKQKEEFQSSAEM